MTALSSTSESTSPRPSRTHQRGYEDPFDADWRERLLVLGSLFGGIAVGLVLGLIYAHGPTTELLGLVPASFFAAGKFLPLWGISDASNFSPWELGVVIWVMDTCTAMLMVYGLEGLYRFERLKAGLHRVQANASLVVEAYPWIRKAAIVGVVVFVLFPVAGTGAVGACFLGILLGMNRHVLIGAVSLGGLLGGMLMAAAAVYFGGAVLALRDTLQDPTVKYASIAAIVLVVLWGVRALNRAYRNALDLARVRGQASR